jgi:hypothetical protein
MRRVQGGRWNWNWKTERDREVPSIEKLASSSTTCGGKRKEARKKEVIVGFWDVLGIINGMQRRESRDKARGRYESS